MEIFWFIFGTVVSLYFYYWYRRPHKFPPGPRGIPVLGALPFLGERPGKTIAKWSKTYGPIMSVRMATKDQVFLNSYDVIVQAFVKQGKSFSARPHNNFIYQTTSGNGIVFTDDENKWKSQRMFGMKTLRGFGFGRKSLESKILEEVKYFNECIHSNKGKPFEVLPLLKNAVLNNICYVILGKRFEYDDPCFQELGKRMMERFAEPVYNAVVGVLITEPNLRYFPPFSSYNKLYLEDYVAVHNVIKDIIKEHETSFDSAEINSFIDAFIKEKRKGEEYFTDDQLAVYTHDLLGAGTETTVIVIAWCILCCLHYPQAQTKIRCEIMEFFGPDGIISMTKKSEMPYTNAFIQEVYRFPALSDINLPRIATEDTELAGYIIPKGTAVITNFWAVNNNLETYEEANKFKPERFLDKKGKFIPSNHVIPYGVGTRNCLGEQMARTEIFMMLVGMLQKFEFLPDPQAEDFQGLEAGSIGFLNTPLPFKVVAHEL